ncbi:ribonuclease III [Halobacteriovorax sp. XZX-3]|uniref:ribonuclease III n=1 Tax=unclassified Halobacteriovorax TaxID=2639665 RepID=UPI003721C1B1
MLETTSLAPQGKSNPFAHAFYVHTIANFKQSGDANATGASEQNHKFLIDTFLKYSNIEEKLLATFNLNFTDNALLMRAFTHSSYAHEAKVKVKSYERLEFYGDSVLGAFVTKNLFLNFENMNEGQLSKLRSALVNEESLSALSNFLGLSNFLIVGKGELDEEVNSGILCDLFESLLGAIAIDQGVDRADQYLNTLLSMYEKEVGEKFFCEKKLLDFDPKTKLQEETLARFKCLPEYRATKIEQEFKIELYVNEQYICELISHSKKNGTKEIAKKCLKDNLLDRL